MDRVLRQKRSGVGLVCVDPPPRAGNLTNSTSDVTWGSVPVRTCTKISPVRDGGGHARRNASRQAARRRRVRLLNKNSDFDFGLDYPQRATAPYPHETRNPKNLTRRATILVSECPSTLSSSSTRPCDAIRRDSARRRNRRRQRDDHERNRARAGADTRFATRIWWCRSDRPCVAGDRIDLVRSNAAWLFTADRSTQEKSDARSI
jgi:hypothetical protein